MFQTRREIMSSPETESLYIPVTELNAILEKIRELLKEAKQLRESMETPQQPVLGQNIVQSPKDQDPK
jgi:hypothetical protein